MSTDDVRQAWRDLVDRRLPAAALIKGDEWPVRFNHCFARILLDNTVKGRWRDSIAAPAWLHADPAILKRAIELGEAVLKGSVSLHELNTISLTHRNKRTWRRTGNGIK